MTPPTSCRRWWQLAEPVAWTEAQPGCCSLALELGSPGAVTPRPSRERVLAATGQEPFLESGAFESGAFDSELFDAWPFDSGARQAWSST